LSSGIAKIYANPPHFQGYRHFGIFVSREKKAGVGVLQRFGDVGDPERSGYPTSAASKFILL